MFLTAFAALPTGRFSRGENQPVRASSPVAYFGACAASLAVCKRSPFVRRALRFLTLSLPLLCPIGGHQTSIAGRCQALFAVQRDVTSRKRAS